MNKRVAIAPRWYGPVPTRNGKPLPKNQWTRAGRKRRWNVRWFAPDGSRPGQTFDTKAEAERFADEKAAEFRSEGSQARLRIAVTTLGEYVDEFLEVRTSRKGRRLSIGTVWEYRTVMNRFADFVGRETPLDRIVTADAIRYLAMIQNSPSAKGRPLSPWSVNKHKGTIKDAMNIAVKAFRYLSVNPFDGLMKDKVPDQSVRYVTLEEFASITRGCRQNARNSAWWECFVTVCYTAATRLNEAAHLMWSDIDFESSTIKVVAKPDSGDLAAWRPKDLDSRTIPVPGETISLLSRLHGEADEGSEYVFLSPARLAWSRAKREAGACPEGRSVLINVTSTFKRIAAQAGVTDVTTHDLRRSCITHWARKLAAPIVQELAGHADIQTTLAFYVKIRDVDLAEAREVAAAALLFDPVLIPNAPGKN